MNRLLTIMQQVRARAQTWARHVRAPSEDTQAIAKELARKVEGINRARADETDDFLRGA